MYCISRTIYINAKHNQGELTASVKPIQSIRTVCIFVYVAVVIEFIGLARTVSLHLKLSLSIH